MASGNLTNFDNFKNLGEDYIGRESQLKEIHSYFSKKSNGKPRILIIRAIGGQGKTQMALEYCRQSQKKYRGIFWLNATSDMTVIGSFEKIATELELISSENLLDASLKIGTVNKTLESWTERWLMVFDKYDLPEDYPDIKRLIPLSDFGDVIITSRNKGLVGLGSILEIPPMTSDEGVLLLLRGHAEQDIERHKEGWSKVVRRLGGLALALDQTAAYLRYKKISIEAWKDFLTTYEAHRNWVHQNMPRDFWEFTRTQAQGLEEQNMAISAFTTWEMLLQEVESTNRQRKTYVDHFLTLSAYFEPTHIGESIFRRRWESGYQPPEWMNIFTTTTAAADRTASPDDGLSNSNALRIGNLENVVSDNALSNGKTGQLNQLSQQGRKWDHIRFLDLIRQLHHELSLLHGIMNIESESSSFSLHPLIRDWVQVRETEEQRQSYTSEAIGFIYSSVTACINASIPAELKSLVVAHLDAGIDAPIPAEQQRLVVANLDACIWNDNKFTRQEYRLGHHVSSCYLVRSFSTFYISSGCRAAAQGLLSAIVETEKQALGKEHPLTLMSMENLAGLYTNQARWMEAEELQAEVIATKSKTSGSNQSDKLQSTMRLVDIYMDQKRWKDAEKLALQVIEERKKILPKEQLNMTYDMKRLARLYMLQSNWKDATEQLSSIAEMEKNALGAEHSHTLSTMMELASVYVFQGKRKEAEELEARVKEIRKKRLGVRHADSLQSVMTFPSVLAGMEKEKAEELFEQMREAAKRVPEPKLSDTEKIGTSLTANRSGFMNEAKELLAQELVLKESVRNHEQDVSEPLKSTNTGPNIKYSVLNQDKQEIRLLTVCSGSFEDEIRCKLHTVSLNATPAYTALSYCWGNKDEQGEVVVDEKKTTIMKSLEIALRYLRNGYEDVVVWVDAICINQENLKEKSSQVRIMSNIYASASHVRIWLGESADDSDVAMDFINQIDTMNFEDPNFELDPNKWKAVKHLLRREWWTRVWVIQESLLAKKPKFYCGRKVADREKFTLLKQAETRYRVGYGPRLRAMQSSLAGPFGLILQDWDYYQDLIAKGRLNLHTAITITTENQCTEPVDKIFALLSMCTELDRQVIKVDYTLSARRLTIMVAKYELMQRGTNNPLYILQLNQADKDPTLPSWVPDFTKCEDGENHFIFPESEDSIPYAAGADNAAWTLLGLARLSPHMVDSLNSITLTIEDEGSFETLVLHGLIVDVITAAFQATPVGIYEGDDLEEDMKVKLDRRRAIINACKEWEAHVQHLPPDRDPYKNTCGRYHAFWRTLIADRDLYWKGPSPPNSDLAGRFEAWIGRRGDKKGDEYEEYIRPFNHPAITRCMYRSFIVTEKGYLGLGSRNTVPFQDHICVLRGGRVPFILRKRRDDYWVFIGEAYVHGIMDGSFVRRAKKEDLRKFRIR